MSCTENLIFKQPLSIKLLENTRYKMSKRIKQLILSSCCCFCLQLAQAQNLDTLYYEDGSIQAVGERNQAGDYHGYWIFWHPNGELRTKGELMNGNQEGAWVFFYDNKEPEQSGTWKNGKRSGVFRHFYESNQLMSTGRYEEDLQTGPWQFFHEHGQLGKTGTYVNAEREGTWNYYYGHGVKSATWNYKNGILVDTAQIYYSNGQLKRTLIFAAEIEAINDLDGTSYDVVKGEPEAHVDLEDELEQSLNMGLEDETLFNNNKTGTWQWFYPNGTVQCIGTFKDNFRVGTWNYYKENGKFNYSETYKNGIKQ